MAYSRIQGWVRDEITAITQLLTILDSLRAGKFESDQLGYASILQASDMPIPGCTVAQLFQAIAALDGLQALAMTVQPGQALTTMQTIMVVRE